METPPWEGGSRQNMCIILQRNGAFPICVQTDEHKEKEMVGDGVMVWWCTGPSVPIGKALTISEQIC